MATEPQDAIGATGDPQLFLLRVWLERGGFRAALRRVGSGEPCVFTRPIEVGEFLSQALQPSLVIPKDEPKESEP